MEAPDKVMEIKGCITGVIALGTALWGSTGWAVVIFLVCMGLDYLTGTFAALHAGEWSSTKARQGLWHKTGEIFALLVAMLTDIALKVILSTAGPELLQGFPVPGTIATLMVSVWYIFTELGSILENADRLGAPLPEFLRKLIAQLRQKTEKEAEKDLPEENRESNEADR